MDLQKLVLSTKRQDMLHDQLRIVGEIDILANQLRANLKTKDQIRGVMKAKIAGSPSLKNNIREEDMPNFVFHDWVRVRKSLLKRWVEEETIKFHARGVATFHNQLEENYNNLLEGLDLDDEDLYGLNVVRHHPYILIPRFFKTVDEVELAPEEYSYVDPHNALVREERMREEIKSLPKNLFANDKSLNEDQKDNIKALLSKQQRRQDTIRFIVRDIMPYQSQKKCPTTETIMLEKLFNAKFIGHKHKSMIKVFKTMDCRQQIRTLLAQWVKLETLIYKERGVPVSVIARQGRFDKIFRPILGIDCENYNLESLLLEDTLGVSMEDVKIVDNAECFESVDGYKVRGLEPVFVFNDEEDCVIAEKEENDLLDHASNLGLIDTVKPDSKFEEVIIRPVQHCLFNLGCKVS